MEKKNMNIHRCLELFSSAIKGYTRYILIFNTKFFFCKLKKKLDLIISKLGHLILHLHTSDHIKNAAQ